MQCRLLFGGQTENYMYQDRSSLIMVQTVDQMFRKQQHWQPRFSIFFFLSFLVVKGLYYIFPACITQKLILVPEVWVSCHVKSETYTY